MDAFFHGINKYEYHISYKAIRRVLLTLCYSDLLLKQSLTTYIRFFFTKKLPKSQYVNAASTSLNVRHYLRYLT